MTFRPQEDFGKSHLKLLLGEDGCSTQKPFGLLQPIPPPTDKFQTKTIDFIGPLWTTAHGFDGIMTVTDAFTKAVTLEPIKFTYGAADIAEIFFKRIISR